MSELKRKFRIPQIFPSTQRQACKLSRWKTPTTSTLPIRCLEISIAANAWRFLCRTRASVGKNWIACKIDHSRAVKRVCNASAKLDEGQRVNVGFVCASLSVGVDSLFAPPSSPASLFSIPGPILIRPRRRDAAAQSLLCVPFSCTWQTKYYALLVCIRHTTWDPRSKIHAPRLPNARARPTRDCNTDREWIKLGHWTNFLGSAVDRVALLSPDEMKCEFDIDLSKFCTVELYIFKVSLT